MNSLRMILKCIRLIQRLFEWAFWGLAQLGDRLEVAILTREQ